MTVYLNGNFKPIEEAYIPVLDRGFIFGDGVYEVIPVYSRRAFRLAEHLKRLQASLDGIRLPNPHSETEWTSLVNELIAKNEGEDQYLYLHITRGVARRDHAFPQPPVQPTVFMMSSPLLHPAAELLASGVSAVTAVDNRWLRCDIKAISLLPNVLLRQQAVDAGCAETILIRDDKFMTEGAASNIFVVKNGTLLAPPKDNLMLPGITYDVVLEIAAANHIPVEGRKIGKDELFTADELLLTSSTREIMPITTLDAKAVGNGKPGPVFARLYTLYQNFKRDVMRQP
ncbi:MAG: D-amino acid aminotransferase [Gallionellales bacterium 35-53-114]|jgi:D-alanine transaminase|nr:MAG: D-amino acid aminotransferase [Gallionellales bacterium 35-53-114]OYZ63691.1 MAG: D-amino acid aminotransferase [Gallionellales bacterium 24-53-125]OZB09476.1 MAG: D-amino acid aminotransferase [Gallionellales bacterium 39-52-133]HQS57857.1 D-amino acid aminotransferase [Gallionellaceae bacterium]HQS76018.1 D-amino acid aminotransferase [Gallionellaceae bacterium]